jgi:ADP-heptose:LPS heptosyltransferase
MSKNNNRKKAFVIRYGAFGDNLILSIVFEKLKQLGYYVIFNTNTRGRKVYKHDNRIDEFLMHDETIGTDKVQEHWKRLKKEYGNCEYFKNFTGSIENNVAIHPVQPLYIHPKKEKFEHCNKNYYEVTADWSGLDINNYRPSLQFTKEEEAEAKKYINKDKYNIAWCLSGSGRNKVYPWTEYVMGSVIQEIPDVNFITVGDEKCKLLENIQHQLPEENFTELAGEVPFRISMLLTKYVDLVVSPDTGILHASGCFDTPKIGLLGHTTKENITKHFKNDCSIEADCACSPCYYLIYDHNIQCPIDPITHAAWCMSVGIQPEKVLKRILQAKTIYGKNTA